LSLSSQTIPVLIFLSDAGSGLHFIKLNHQHYYLFIQELSQDVHQATPLCFCVALHHFVGGYRAGSCCSQESRWKST
jgi:hypothetical protein